MKLHGSAKLSPASRRLLVARVREEGWAVGRAAESLGVSERTAYKWLRRFEDEGASGLFDRSSRPRDCPHRTPQRKEKRILRLRGRRLVAWQIAQQTGVPRSTVSRVLERHGLGRLENLEPKPTVRRYERSRPGELVHLDVKKLGRFQRPGHRVHGDRRRNSSGAGWECVHVAVDDYTRLAYVEVLPNERKETVTGFLTRTQLFFQEQGIQIERVLTDNGSGYRSRLFRDRCREIGAEHKKTKPYRPQTNGKAERFIQTLCRGWAYAKSYRSSKTRANALPNWLQHYNHKRPHQALGGIAPCQRLKLSA
jgi:transposase InsO family protein